MALPAEEQQEGQEERPPEASASNPWKHKVLTAFVARDKSIIVDATVKENEFQHAVDQTADAILNTQNDRPCTGWDAYTYKKPKMGGLRRSLRKCPPLKALKLELHEYDNPAEEYEDDHNDNTNDDQEREAPQKTVWSFCCVYNPEATTWNHPYGHVEDDIKSFLKEIERLSASLRETPSWRTSDPAEWAHSTCQEEFGPVLTAAMQEVNYLGWRDRVNASVAEAKQTMDQNLTIMLEENRRLAEHMQETAGELLDQSKVFKKKTKSLKDNQKWKNRKTQLVLGGAVVGAAGVVVGPVCAVALL